MAHDRHPGPSNRQCFALWIELQMRTVHRDSKDVWSQRSGAFLASESVSTLWSQWPRLVLWRSRVLRFSCCHLLLSDRVSLFILKSIQSLNQAQSTKALWSSRVSSAHYALDSVPLVTCQGSQSFGVANWEGGDQLGVTAKTVVASVFKWTPRFEIFYSSSL